MYLGICDAGQKMSKQFETRLIGQKVTNWHRIAILAEETPQSL